MKRYINFKLLAMMLAVVGLLSGCSMMEEDYPVDTEQVSQKVKAYIKLHITIPGDDVATRSGSASASTAHDVDGNKSRIAEQPLGETRATGGENGDGREQGQTQENAIKSALVFFFQGTEGVNSLATTSILRMVEFDGVSEGEQLKQDGDAYTITHEVEGMTLGAEYDVVAVINHLDEQGNDRTGLTSKSSLTLEDVRDAIVRSHYTATTATVGGKEQTTYSNFLMSSEKDCQFILDGTSEANATPVEITVERVTARVDYKVSYNNTSNDAFEPFLESHPLHGAKVRFDGGCIINRMMHGSYLLKRVSRWGGFIYNTEAPIYLGDEEKDDNGYKYVYDPWSFEKSDGQTGITIDGAWHTGFGVLYEGGYATGRSGERNTYYPNIKKDPDHWASNGYITPGDELSCTSADDNSTEEWRRLGYTMENVTAANRADETRNTGVVFRAKIELPDAITHEDDGTFYEYISGNEVAYGSLATMNTALGTDYTDSEDYATLLSAGIRKFTNGYAYYIWWIEHISDNDTSKESIMEHAIVRNNIYKLNITGVTRLGNNVPSDDEPGLLLRVVVNNWTLAGSEDIRM